MPRHRRPKIELPDNAAVKRLVDQLVGEAREANMGTDAFEARLSQVLTRAADEIVTAAKSRPAGRAEPRARRKR
jgi:hypothetical protein